MAGQSKHPRSLETLLRCALEEPDTALERWRTLLDEHPLDNFSYPEQRMLPAVLANLKKATDPIPEETRLRGVSRYTFASNSKLHKVCREAVAHLQSVGIESIVLKGIYFNSDIHQNLGLRPATDVDILVRRPQVEKALEALISQGWRVKGKWAAPQEGVTNEVCLVKGGNELDLHWSLLVEARIPKWNDVFWDNAVPFELGPVQAKTLSLTHHLFHLLVAACRDPEDQSRYLYDLAILVQRFGDALDYHEIEPMLRERHLLSRVKKLPLQELGLSHLLPTSKPSLLDELWSAACRRGEWNYLFFPFFDYWINYRHSSPPGGNLFTYLKNELDIQSFRDLFIRSVKKLTRLVRAAK